MTFTTETKKVGNKTRIAVRCGGVEIGYRTSARPYRFALIVTRNQEAELEGRRSCLDYDRETAARYEALAARDEQAITLEISEHNLSRASVEESINDGSYAGWAAKYRAGFAKQEERIAQLASGPLPEFSTPYVLSWHQARHNVPAAPPWTKFVAVVEIR